jgi:DNA-binding CsgD family transcriptional regulator
MTRGPNYQKERGERQEQRIIASLTEKPKTPAQIAEALSLGLSNVSIYTRRLKRQGRIYISGHEGGVGRPAPIFAVGSLPDVEYVPKRRNAPIKTVDMRLAEVRNLLESGHTSRELGQKLHVTRGRAQKLVQMLKEQTPVRIVGWRHPGHRGDLAPIYRLGKGEDAPKPRETRAQRYAKEKANPEKHERNLKRRRAQYHIDKARKKPNGIFGALGI